ncbi:hypothetical protein COEX109129_16990 [Corallococcus exiguus]
MMSGWDALGTGAVTTTGWDAGAGGNPMKVSRRPSAGPSCRNAGWGCGVAMGGGCAGCIWVAACARSSAGIATRCVRDGGTGGGPTWDWEEAPAEEDGSTSASSRSSSGGGGGTFIGSSSSSGRPMCVASSAGRS